MKRKTTFCAGLIFIFSLTTAALEEKLNLFDIPHLHAEIFKPKTVPSVAMVGASGTKHLEISVADSMPWCDADKFNRESDSVIVKLISQ